MLIKHPKVKEREQNIKALRILVEQYLKEDKKRVINKLKKEQ